MCQVQRYQKIQELEEDQEDNWSYPGKLINRSNKLGQGLNDAVLKAGMVYE